jgi:hypothetical protein
MTSPYAPTWDKVIPKKQLKFKPPLTSGQFLKEVGGSMLMTGTTVEQLFQRLRSECGEDNLQI